jgi:hypothetical protein
MPIGITQKIKERKKTILELLVDGCKPTSYIVRALNLTHTEAFYALKRLTAEGYIKEVLFGRVAIWCLNDEHYNKLVNIILQEIRRIVESHSLKYIYATRLYKLILNDPKAYNLLSQYVPLDRQNSSAKTFLNYLLNLLYGPPYFIGEKIVYITNRPKEVQKPTD